MHAPRKLTMAQRLIRSRYFLFAVLIHLLVFMMLATVVIIPMPETQAPYLIASPPGAEDSIKVPDYQQSNKVDDSTPPVVAISNGTKTAIDPAPLITTVTGAASIRQINLAALSPNRLKDPPKILDAAHNAIAARVPEIDKTVKNWRPAGAGRYEIKIYLAKYAQGDWDTALALKNGRVAGGALTNLAQSLQGLTRGKVRAEVVPIPLNLASTEILETRPPFIFFTGHKDFTLTDAETENLRKYLIMGGAIWADNGLAGPGSRFDVAFRREIKKVLPSKDQNFEILPDDHRLLTKGYFPIREVPAGMNFSREPIEVIFMDGQIAVLYTLNDYTDMLRMMFRSDLTTPELIAGPDREFVTPSDLWQYRHVYYRNFTPESCAQVYRFSANIVFYLLTRFDDLLFGADASR